MCNEPYEPVVKRYFYWVLVLNVDCAMGGFRSLYHLGAAATGGAEYVEPPYGVEEGLVCIRGSPTKPSSAAKLLFKFWSCITCDFSFWYLDARVSRCSSRAARSWKGIIVDVTIGEYYETGHFLSRRDECCESIESWRSMYLLEVGELTLLGFKLSLQIL